MDSETLRQIYVPKWNVVNESVLDDPDVCCSLVDQLAPPGLFSQLHDMDYDQLFAEFNVGAARQTCLGAEVRMRFERYLRERKRLEGKCAKQGIHPGSQVSAAKAAGAARVSDLNSLKERNTTLEKDKDALKGQVVALEFVAATKDTELADGLIDQDEQVKVLSDHVAGLDSKLMALARHSDEELYHRFLTTIAEYAATFGAVIGLAIDKGIQTGLVAGIDHRKARRGLANVVSYDPSMEARYLFVVLDFRDLDFNLLSQLKSQKDASIAYIMDSLRLKGPFAETPEASRLQPAYEQLICLSTERRIITSEIPATAATTNNLSISVIAASVSSIPPISMVDYGVLDAGIQGKVPHSLKIVFEKETLETTPERPTTS
ncbi:hypothetical protein Tco_0164863 [Tanacetum coccineum]